MKLAGLNQDDTFVVAVSGGVDSMTLLDLVRQNFPTDHFVAAHFQHNVRSSAETEADRELIEGYCKKYHIELELGSYSDMDTSEAVLRKARYEFLDTVREKYGYNKIITAHHKDDVIETAIINLLRGTNSAGLASLTSTDQITRPLLDVSKVEIREYAEEQRVLWREDATNADESYLRNYVRRTLIPKLESTSAHQELIDLLAQHQPIDASLRAEVDEFINANLLRYENGIGLDRQLFIQLPHVVSTRVMRELFNAPSAGIESTKTLVEKATAFAKTARHGARMDVSKQAYLHIDGEHIALLNKA